jgi:23S rRNA (uracil1939-C5)-methyltransferase
VSGPETIIRIAAKGDGVTQSGAHVKGAVPGDMAREDGSVEPGPHHVPPPCPHFGRCGGCQLQHADEETLTKFVTSRVVNAAQGQGMEPAELLPTHLSPPKSRRRATLHALRTQNGAVIGFRQGGSHAIVDLKQCEILHPDLMAHVEGLRSLIAAHAGKGGVDIGMALCDQGVDLSLTNIPIDGLSPTQALLDYARDTGLARLSVDYGYGPEALWEPEPATVTLSGVPVTLPVGAFLQATLDAEARMVADARELLEGAGKLVDLFSGLGTFTLGLGAGRKALGVEADRAAHLAAKAAASRTGGRVFAMHRDLFRNPLQAEELNNFDAALLDPPRAGAKAQVAQIAVSQLERVVYVSCNPSSWSRDAAVLAQAGFALAKLRPVGQFRWSTHVELVSYFTR